MTANFSKSSLQTQKLTSSAALYHCVCYYLQRAWRCFRINGSGPRHHQSILWSFPGLCWGSPNDHLTSCICGWEFCSWYLAIFCTCNQTGGDDLDALRGGPCFKINISGSGKKQVKWRECVLSNLLVSEKVQEWVGKEPDERVHVAPHHYSLAMLWYFASSNHKKSTPVTWQQARAIQDPFDEEDNIKTSKGTHYFLAPNYPEHLVHISAESDSRCNERTLNRTASNLEREEAQRQQEFDQLTLQQYVWLMATTSGQHKLQWRKPKTMLVFLLQSKSWKLARTSGWITFFDKPRDTQSRT